MKTKLLLHTCFAAVFVVVTVCATGDSTVGSPQQNFQEAMYLELGRGDISAAARLYEQLASGTDSLNELRARARWRLALCEQKLGHTTRSIFFQESLLEAISDTASPELQQVRDAAAQSLLELAEQATPSVQKEMAQEIYQRLRQLDPQAIEKYAQHRTLTRCKLHIVITTCDGHPAANANIRILVQAGPFLSSTTSADPVAWHGSTNARGQLLIELPAGQYEIRASTPFCDRQIGLVTLLPEKEDPVDLALTLGYIKLPAIVHQVFLLGNWFDNWSTPIPMAKVAEGVWETRLRIKPGRYEYKFHIDDQIRWLTDVSAIDFKYDGFDGFWELLNVDKEQEITFHFDEHDPHFERLPP